MPAPKPVTLPQPMPFDEAIRRALKVAPEPKAPAKPKKRAGKKSR